MTKNFFAIATISTALLIVASCGSNDDQTRTEVPATPSPIPATKELPIEAPASGISTANESNVAPSAVFSAYDIKGTLRKSTEWIGTQPVVINFWGTWCPPCRREIPDLVKLYKEYRFQGVELLGLAVRDTPDKVINFSRQAGMEWVMLIADSEVASQYQLRSVPTTIFYDRRGNEVARLVGMRSYEDFKTYFEAISKS